MAIAKRNLELFQGIHNQCRDFSTCLLTTVDKVQKTFFDYEFPHFIGKVSENESGLLSVIYIWCSIYHDGIVLGFLNYLFQNASTHIVSTKTYTFVL